MWFLANKSVPGRIVVTEAVFLDTDTLGQDVDLSPLQQAVNLQCFSATAPEQVAQRLAAAEVVVVNKVVLNDSHFAAAPQLRGIVVTATGVNNIDLDAAKARGIRVVNAVGYARPILVQHTFSLILALSNRLLDYVEDTRAGRWQQSPMFCRMDHPIRELAGKTLGLIGYGDLGQGVARVAEAFGMTVRLAARPGQGGEQVDGYVREPLKSLLPQVDVLSIHCLLSEQTRHLISRRELTAMKASALLINTARGGIVHEQDLADALRAGDIAGAGLDVLSQEPPVNGNPLLAPDIPNLLLTPHCAWASQEARQRMVQQSADNLGQLVAGTLSRWVV
ncbi:MAG: glycerate dehydrogenase [Halomonadaceae bacterium]|nr:MAG: glycerate dehydrogenase [Halomonadaceae bacterium]